MLNIRNVVTTREVSPHLILEILRESGIQFSYIRIAA